MLAFFFDDVDYIADAVLGHPQCAEKEERKPIQSSTFFLPSIMAFLFLLIWTAMNYNV